MRTLIVAALMATAALAHDCGSTRSCSSALNNVYGLCVRSESSYASVCGANGHKNIDYDAVLPIDRSCFNIQPVYAEVRDNNGTISAEAYMGGFGGGSSSSANVVKWTCDDNRNQESPLCTKNGGANLTYASVGFSSSASIPSHHDSTGTYIYSNSISVNMDVIVPRQAATLFYNGEDNSLEVNRDTVFIKLSLSRSVVPSGGVPRLGASEKAYVLFRLAAPGGNPAQVSLGDGARKTANGMTFLEKASQSTRGTYVSGTGGNPSYYPYTYSWFTPSMDVVERYELNGDTWMYEKHQFLRVEVKNTDNDLYATIGKPAMDGSGIAHVATLAAAAVAAVVAMMMATA